MTLRDEPEYYKTDASGSVVYYFDYRPVGDMAKAIQHIVNKKRLSFSKARKYVAKIKQYVEDKK